MTRPRARRARGYDNSVVSPEYARWSRWDRVIDDRNDTHLRCNTAVNTLQRLHHRNPSPGSISAA